MTAPAVVTLPVLLAVSHGTSSGDGQAAVAALVQTVASSRPDLEVAAGFVDVQQPDMQRLLGNLGGLERRMPAVVVPLLLSAGYHVQVDLAREVDVEERVERSEALGPDDRLVDILVERLHEAGLLPSDAVVLAAAGSSDARAVKDCNETARRLARALGRPVTVGFLSAAYPRLTDAIATVREVHPFARVVVSTYLLAPGYFNDLAQEAGADVTTQPLLRSDAAVPAHLVELVLDRYDAAVAATDPVA